MKSMKAKDIIEFIELPASSGVEAYSLKRRLMNEAPVRELIKALRESESPDVRQFLCYILGDIQAKSAGSILVEYLSDPSSVVRDNAAEAIAKIDYSPAGETLLKRLEIEPDIEIQRRLLVALGAVGFRTAIPVLIDNLASQDSSKRGCAAWSLGALKATEALDALHGALANEMETYPQTRMKEALEVIRGNIYYDKAFVPIPNNSSKQ